MTLGVVGVSVLSTTCENTPYCAFYFAPHIFFILIAATAFYLLQRYKNELIASELAPLLIVVFIVFAGQELLALFFALTGLNAPSSFATSDYDAITRCLTP